MRRPSLIGDNMGQITIAAGAMLDHDTKSSYTFTVKATDADNNIGEIRVTVTVTDVNEGPEFETPDETKEYAENGTGPVTSFKAKDPEGSRRGVGPGRGRRRRFHRRRRCAPVQECA